MSKMRLDWQIASCYYLHMNTKKRLILAMKALLDKYSVEQITTQMIVEQSDVSKATLYRYFPDKYALMAEYYNYGMEHCLPEGDHSFVTKMNSLLQFFKKNRSYFIRLVNQKGSDDFYHVFFKHSFKSSKDLIENTKGSPLSEEEQNLLHFFISGCAITCAEWISSGMLIDTMELAQQLIRCTPKDLIKYIK